MLGYHRHLGGTSRTTLDRYMAGLGTHRAGLCRVPGRDNQARPRPEPEFEGMTKGDNIEFLGRRLVNELGILPWPRPWERRKILKNHLRTVKVPANVPVDQWHEVEVKLSAKWQGPMLTKTQKRWQKVTRRKLEEKIASLETIIKRERWPPKEREAWMESDFSAETAKESEEKKQRIQEKSADEGPADVNMVYTLPQSFKAEYIEYEEMADDLTLSKSAEKADKELSKLAVKANVKGPNELRRRTAELNLEESPIKVGDKKLETHDLLTEVNLGSDEDKRPTYISAKLSVQQQEKLKELLMEYKDCFAWSYEEMPGLSREVKEKKKEKKEELEESKILRLWGIFLFLYSPLETWSLG
uniref:Uncharacterized protein n=1 Tax=Ananas comosus var. bracteatus TaxID=296719 RepID=A0A6V7PXY5_ANACO|nr:unnamed protein product [Ananas comosus var. bracteatus]